MKIVKVHYQVESNGVHATLYNVEFASTLPTTLKCGDVVTTEPHSLGSRFKLCSVNVPASNRATVKPLRDIKESSC